MPNRKSVMTSEMKNIIIKMFKAGRQLFVIVTELNINHSTTYKFLNRYKETGSTENISRTGCLPKWIKCNNNQI